MDDSKDQKLLTPIMWKVPEMTVQSLSLATQKQANSCFVAGLPCGKHTILHHHPFMASPIENVFRLGGGELDVLPVADHDVNPAIR